MGWVWNPFGALGIVAMVFAVAMGIFVLAARPEREQNRRLAALLVAEGFLMGFGGGLMYLAEDQATAEHLQMATITAGLLIPLLQLRFLATLRTPLARPLRPVAVQLLLAAATIGALAWWALRPQQFLAGSNAAAYAPWEAIPGPAYVSLNYVLGVLSIFALAASIHSYWKARPDSARRKRTKAFALAFGVRDGNWILVLLVIGPLLPWMPAWTVEALFIQGPPIVTIVFVALMAVGILRTQLFDIDLKIKWTLDKGTIGVALIALFFIAKEGVEQLLPFEGILPGILAAALVSAVFVPVQRLSHRLADRVMPGVEAPQYLDGKRYEVYRAALEGMWEDGDVTEKERRMLARLRDQLEIREDDARQLELRLIRSLKDATVQGVPSGI